ncbi:hypothetical protein Astex_2187 [Asticcacaulis excentricus CB 48]|uniref:Outer membrane beta-barrel protein n=2 Tax=Asticcacaulis excentricus TaxID=78587 RepID=E8RM94_ASTEC|nr:hypothetical protein Astex_2187 [Asticcacaulis excentricus CB 48]
MKTILYMSAALAALAAGSAQAQQATNNFQRDRNTAVTDRYQPGYEPLGVKAGVWKLNPTVTVSLGGNDNIYYVPSNKEGSAIITVSPNIVGRTTWSRHELGFNAGVDSNVYLSQSDENNTGYNVGANGRLDITSRAMLSGNIRHLTTYEPRSAYQSDVEAAEPVRIDSDAAELQLTLIGNRLRFIGTVSTRNDDFKDVARRAGLPGSPIISQRYRDLTTSGATARFDYAVSPAISVFLTAVANNRRYDTATINDSDGTVIALGTSFDISSLARGELQLGTVTQEYKDPTIGKQDSGYVNARVQYFPTPLTTLTGTLNRDFVDYPGSGGTTRTALNTTVGLSVDHELLRNLIVSAGVRGQKYEFDGIDRNDTGKTVMLGARYLMNRRISIETKYSYVTYESEGTQAFRDYNANVIMTSLIFAY